MVCIIGCEASRLLYGYPDPSVSGGSLCEEICVLAGSDGAGMSRLDTHGVSVV